MPCQVCERSVEVNADGLCPSCLGLRMLDGKAAYLGDEFRRYDEDQRRAAQHYMVLWDRGGNMQRVVNEFQHLFKQGAMKWAPTL